MKKNPLLYGFMIILFCLTIADIVKGDKKFSDLENRNLRQKVEFTVSSFFNGDFSKEYEEYINDQFIGRDIWINIKSRSEYTLGKIENNGIIYGDENFLFDKFSSVDLERLNTNTLALKEFFSRYGDKSKVMLIPNSYEVYKEYLPKGAPSVDQESYIEKIYNELPDKKGTVDILEVMRKNKNQYIYYKTDHHYTINGAYLSYRAFMESIGEKPKDISYWGEAIKIEDFYGTYFSKAKPFNAQKDILSYYEIKGLSMKIGEETYDNLYDYNYLKTRDKYSLYLRGNNPLTIIKNNNLKNGKKLLVIKDSFGNSMIPFLTAHYEEIQVVDLRSFMPKLSEYIKDNEYDNIIVLYNFMNFVKDTNIIKLKF